MHLFIVLHMLLLWQSFVCVLMCALYLCQETSSSSYIIVLELLDLCSLM